MAKQPAKRRVQGGGSGRVTPKGGATPSAKSGPAASARYTPPVPKEMKVSPSEKRFSPLIVSEL